MFVKLFADLMDSSLWSESSDTRIVWITLLMMADETGLVRSTAPGITKRAGVNLAHTRAALEKFEAPDPESRTLVLEGRRIERVDGGYQIVNYLAYRNLRNKDARREYMRTYMAQRRAKERGCKQPVNPVSPVNLTLAQAEADTDTEASTPPAPLLLTVNKTENGKEVPEGAEQLAFKVYGNVPGELAQWYRIYPLPWVLPAIEETERCGKTNAAYTHAILERWRKEGAPQTGHDARTVPPRAKKGDNFTV